jgi:hypothetical protein
MTAWLIYGSTLHTAAEKIQGWWMPHGTALMIRWTLRRYERIRRVLADVKYDYRRFPDVYWPEVGRELTGPGVDLWLTVSTK